MDNRSQRSTAIVAGVAFLIMTIAAGFAYGYVLGNLIVPGDAAATASKIAASGALFRASIVSFLVVLITDLVVAWALYVLLKPANGGLSALAAWFRLVYAAILGMALLNLANALRYSGGAVYLTAFTPEQLNAQVLSSLNAFSDGWAIGLAVFGCHLLVLGYLVYRSGYMPRILGVLLVVGGLGYLAQNIAVFLLPDYAAHKAAFDAVLSIPLAAGELSLAFWLLFRGGKDPASKTLAS